MTGQRTGALGDPRHLPSPPDPATTRRLADRAVTVFTGATTGSGAAAVAAAIRDEVATLAGEPDTAVAWPTIDVVPAAVTALLASGVTDAADIATGIDLAASLMVFAAPDDENPALTAHVEIVGALVPTLLRAGITPMPGALSHTLSAAIGRDVTGETG